MAIRRIWLQQPIAFARAGGSGTPLSAFRWTEPDLRPHGTALTAIFPDDSFDVDAAGRLVPRPDPFVLFKDEVGIRPVCPFFELHGEWDGQPRRADGTPATNVTVAVLRAQGLSLSDIAWAIRHANHKAFCVTHAPGDRIEARLEFPGDVHDERPLVGFSPGPNPLVDQTSGGIAMGALRAIRPTAEFPEIRLRFIAPKGLAYAPRDFDQRIRTGGHSRNPFVQLLNRLSLLIPRNKRWKSFPLPPQRCALNPDAAWPQYRLVTLGQIGDALLRIVSHPRTTLALARAFDTQSSEFLRFALGPKADVGKLPPGLYASWLLGMGGVLSSLGIVDDLGDGIISCTLKGVGTAKARIVVAPPHFSPDRRPPVSIADDLADKEKRGEARNPSWASGGNWNEAKAEIEDLLDRAFETASASNLDAWADQRREENESAAIYRGDKSVPLQPAAPIWSLGLDNLADLPLFELGRLRHHRNSADEFMEQIARDNEGLMVQWIRDQDDPLSMYYDKRMPALMRGSDRRPLHLTRRQFAAFARWFEATRARTLAAEISARAKSDGGDRS